MPAGQVLDFLHPLPVTALWGVGERTAESLHRLGLRTVADLAATPADTLRRAVGVAGAEHLSALAAGLDPRPVEPDEVEKSISADRTMDADLVLERDVRRELLRLAEEVGTRVRSRGFVARTVGIKIRFADFRTITRVRTLPSWTASTGEIFQTAADLYRGLDLDQPRVRLVGVKCENLRDADGAPEQLTLDLTRPERVPADDSGRKAADRAIDAARSRFGPAAVTSGSLLGQHAEAGSGPVSSADRHLSRAPRRSDSLDP